MRPFHTLKRTSSSMFTKHAWWKRTRSKYQCNTPFHTLEVGHGAWVLTTTFYERNTRAYNKVHKSQLFPHFSFKNWGKKSRREERLYNIWYQGSPLSSESSLCPNQAIHKHNLEHHVSVASIQEKQLKEWYNVKLKNFLKIKIFLGFFLFSLFFL